MNTYPGTVWSWKTDSMSGMKSTMHNHLPPTLPKRNIITNTPILQMAMWDRYFQAVTFIYWSRLQRLKQKNSLTGVWVASIYWSHFIQDYIPDLQEKNQLVTDLEHQDITLRTILHLDHKCGEEVFADQAGSSQVLELQWGARGCWHLLHPLLPTVPSNTDTRPSRGEFAMDGVVTNYWKEAKETQTTPASIHELLLMSDKWDSCWDQKCGNSLGSSPWCSPAQRGELITVKGKYSQCSKKSTEIFQVN